MDGPSAMVRLLLQGRKLNPSVYMSESERMPGKRNRSQVPPSVCRSSRMAKLLVGRWAFTKQAAPMPESPAPTMSTSTCCGCGPPRCAMSAAPDRSEAASVLDGMGLNPDGGGQSWLGVFEQVG